MGQVTSKGIRKAAQNFVKKAADTTPPATPLPPTPGTTKVTTAANPAMFLRGEGVASQDIRDNMQEMYLQNARLGVDSKGDLKPVSTSDSNKNTPHEMPADLLQFIQDVGPAKQVIDKERTTPRLMEKENEEELNKAESIRKPIRERRRMPLMGQDQNFTTDRNTHFRQGSEEAIKDFGASNLQFHGLLAKKQQQQDLNSFEATVDLFAKSVNEKQEGWTEQELEQQRQRLKRALEVMHLPVLRKTTEGDIYGLYAEEVPGAEVKSVQVIPPTKVKFVLQDILDLSNNETKVQGRLASRRQQRKGAVQ